MSDIESVQSTDVAIIGAGPVGLFAVFECGMLKMRCHVIDTLDFAGGQCAALFPEKPIYDIPGYPKIMAADLIDRLVEQAAPFDPVYHLGQQVTAIKRENDQLWQLTTSQGNKITAKAVIVAAGCGAFGPNRPPIDDIENYEGKSVFYHVRRREDFRDKKIVIAGGGDSALDWALSLAELAAKIYVVHRRSKFRGSPETIAKLYSAAEKSDTLELVVPYQLHDLEGNDGKLESVIVRDLDNQTRALKADVLLPFFGLSMNLGPIADWGLNLDQHHIIVEASRCETNQGGIFAIGDIARYPGKLKLILSGFSEAAMAAHAIYGLVYKDKTLHWEYSTTKGVPGIS